MFFKSLLLLLLPLSLRAFYDPLTVFPWRQAVVHELSIEDPKWGRTLAVKAFVPGGDEALPVLIYSHGLGGDRHEVDYLGKHWAGRGYVCLMLQHPGSDVALWKGAEPKRRHQVLQEASSGKQLMVRVHDIQALLHHLPRMNSQEKHPLEGRLQLTKIGLSGHSLGAVSTQAMAGQSFGGMQFMKDDRIGAALLFSPSPPQQQAEENSFSKVSIPWMMVTGTADSSPIQAVDPSRRREVYRSLPQGQAYELVLDGAKHSSFTDRQLPGEPSTRTAVQSQRILAFTSAYWDASLKQDRQALHWLQQRRGSFLLAKQDSWQWK